MKYNITEHDKELLLQGNLQYKIRVTVTDKSRKVIDVLYGTAETGGISVDSDSDIRRTFSFTLIPDKLTDQIESKISGWIGLYYEVDIGILDQRNGKFVYYPNGRFCITSASTSYHATTNTISFDLSDRISELDGTRNGQIGGAPVITIPREINGNKQTIRNTAVNLLSSSTEIDKYIIDDIGEYYGMPQNNENYLDYRNKNDEWNILPYDLEFSSGDTVSNMLFEIRDLFPACQMYFDVYDNFCFDMLPTLEKDLPDMDDPYLQKILLADNSESVSYDIQSIKNVTEVFGKIYNVDHFSDSAFFADNTYSIPADGYNAYRKYDLIAFTIPHTNGTAPKLKINDLQEIPVYYEYTEQALEENCLISGDTCVVELYRSGENYIAYYLGEYQPHALCVLTNGEDCPNGKFSKKYFSEKYNVKEKNILFRTQNFSPFSVQKLGEILESYSGNDFENILSDSNAVQNAEYYNRISSTLFDTVTISTVLIPWLDVNVKINYKKQQENTAYSYIVKSRKDDFSNGTSSITMYRFMQLYE